MLKTWTNCWVTEHCIATCCPICCNTAQSCGLELRSLRTSTGTRALASRSSKPVQSIVLTGRRGEKKIEKRHPSLKRLKTSSSSPGTGFHAVSNCGREGSLRSSSAVLGSFGAWLLRQCTVVAWCVIQQPIP